MTQREPQQPQLTSTTYSARSTHRAPHTTPPLNRGVCGGGAGAGLSTGYASNAERLADFEAARLVAITEHEVQLW